MFACIGVALRKESVDRNNVQPRKTDTPGASLSARRAWIEIINRHSTMHRTSLVALRKESVDRNFATMQIVIIVVESLSARRAWIEIA